VSHDGNGFRPKAIMETTILAMRSRAPAAPVIQRPAGLGIIDPNARILMPSSTPARPGIVANAIFSSTSPFAFCHHRERGESVRSHSAAASTINPKSKAIRIMIPPYVEGCDVT